VSVARHDCGEHVASVPLRLLGRLARLVPEKNLEWLLPIQRLDFADDFFASVFRFQERACPAAFGEQFFARNCPALAGVGVEVVEVAPGCGGAEVDIVGDLHLAGVAGRAEDTSFAAVTWKEDTRNCHGLCSQLLVVIGTRHWLQ
jgi:hypothetical protein